MAPVDAHPPKDSPEEPPKGPSENPQEGIQVEVVFCPAASQAQRVSLRLPLGSTLAQAVQASGLQVALDPGSTLDAGVWGRRRSPGTLLRDADRVEIYRALRCDPKQARRERHRGPLKAPRAAPGKAPRAAPGEAPTEAPPAAPSCARSPTR